MHLWLNSSLVEDGGGGGGGSDKDEEKELVSFVMYFKLPS